MKSKNPDKIIFHDITNCEYCKSELPKQGEIKSRLFDIPKIKIEVTEHQNNNQSLWELQQEKKIKFPKRFSSRSTKPIYPNMVHGTKIVYLHFY